MLIISKLKLIIFIILFTFLAQAAKNTKPNFDYEQYDDGELTDLGEKLTTQLTHESNFNQQSSNSDKSNIAYSKQQIDSKPTGFFIRLNVGQGISKYKNGPPLATSSLPTTLPVNVIYPGQPNQVLFYAFSEEVAITRNDPNLVLVSNNFSSQSQSPTFDSTIGYKITKNINLELSASSLTDSQITNSAPLTIFFANSWNQELSDDSMYWGAQGTLNRKYVHTSNAFIIGTNLYPIGDNNLKPFLNFGIGAIKLTEQQTQYFYDIKRCDTDNTTVTNCVPAMLNTESLALANVLSSVTSITKTLPAYQLGFGGEYKFNEQVSLEARYKYLKAIGKTPLSKISISHHIFSTGLIFNF